MTRLALPTREDLTERLAGARSGRERLRRTVAEAYGIYERGGDTVAAIRRDRDQLGLLQEAHEQVEEALAAIVDVGLGERLTDDDARVVRALLDLDAWRALRDQGVTGADAVETTAGMLDAGLARRRRTGAAPAAALEAAEAPEGRLLFAMDVPRVLLFGVFNFSLIYIAGLFALLQTFDRFLPFDIYDPARWVGLVDEYLPHRWTVGAIAAVLFVAVLLGSAAGVLRTLARDYGFRLSLEDDRFRREHGLFTRSEAVIARRRVQLATVGSGPLRSLFGWSGLSFQTLGAGADRSGRQSAAPFATRSEIEAVLAEVPPMRLPPPPELACVSRRHILRSAAAKLAPAAAAIAALSVWDRSALLLLALLPLLAVAAALERRFHRYALADDLLFVARGVWRRRLWLVPLRNIQSIGLSRGPIQRRLGLATLAIDTAGASLLGGPRIVDLRAGDAEALAAEISRRRRAYSGRKSGTER